METAVVDSSEVNRQVIVRRGVQLQYFTLVWNIVECGVAVTAGVLAGSISLIGFGIDSAIEVSSSLAALWRLLRDDSDSKRARAERIAGKIIGFSFLALAAYVTFESIESLWRHEAPLKSIPGIILAAISVVIMPLIARAKRKIAAQLSSSALVSDSQQTNICAYLSAILLVGLIANSTLNWWWADAVAGLIMVPIIAYEGIQSLKGRPCTDCGCRQ